LVANGGRNDKILRPHSTDRTLCGHAPGCSTIRTLIDLSERALRKTLFTLVIIMICNVCNSSQSEILFQAQDYEHGVPGSWTIV
jgi:hypothetical protein